MKTDSQEGYTDVRDNGILSSAIDWDTQWDNRKYWLYKKYAALANWFYYVSV